MPVGNLKVHAGVAGKRHLGHRGQQAAVGAVVVGEDLFIAAELLDDVPEILEIGGVVHIGRGLAHLGYSLGEDRSAEAVLSPTQINQQQNRIPNALQVIGHRGH